MSTTNTATMPTHTGALNPSRTLATATRVLRQLRHDPRTIALMILIPCVMLLLLLGTIALNVYLYVAVPKTFLPQQDTGLLMGMIRGDDGLSFQVAAGEVYGLLGPNGAGKTTTLRMLLGLLRPSAGRATIEGFSSLDAPDEVKRRVGLVSATAGLYPHLSVREQLLFFADLYGVPAAQARAFVANHQAQRHV